MFKGINNELSAMIRSMWPGMFQAEAGSGNTASVRSTGTRLAARLASYAISDEQGARKKVLDNRQ
jgi:hypothetical protein